MTSQKIILDTDIGDDIDDALALALVLNSPELDLLGVTTVTGRVAERTVMALHELELYGRRDVPVATGLGKPLLMPIRDVPVTQAAGIDAASLAPPDPRGAVRFLIDTVLSAPGEVILVPIGALTNIAAALVAQPSLAASVKHIVLMGGMVGQQMAEYNIACDPEAARIVFESGADIRMVGLDVTLQCRMNKAHLERFAASTKPTVQWLWSRIQIWQNGQADLGPTLHDPLAVATILDPSLVTTARRRVVVETRGEATRGFTRGFTDGQPNADACLDVDAQRFVELFVDRLVEGA